jgi:hypothetical protein
MHRDLPFGTLVNASIGADRALYTWRYVEIEIKYSEKK